MKSHRSSSLKPILKISVAAILSAVFFWLYFRGTQVSDLLEPLRHVRWTYFSAAILIGLSIPWILALQWKVFFPKNHPVKVSQIFPITSVCLMVGNVVPFWAGQTLGVYLLSRREKLRHSRAISLIFLNQITDGFSRLLLFLLVGITAPLPEWMKKAMQIVFALVLLAYALLLVFAWKYRHWKEPEIKADGLRQKLKHSFANWAHSMEALRSPVLTVWAILLEVLIRAIEVVGFLLVQRAFGLELPWWSACFLLAATNLATMLPITPGQVGFFEAAIFTVYRILGVEETQARVLGVAHHFAQLAPLICMGAFFSLRLGVKINPTKSVDPKKSETHIC